MQLTGHKIELFVDDVEASVEFYRRVLGFEVGATREAMLGGRMVAHTPVWNGPVMIGLGRLADQPAGHHLRRAGLESERGVGVELCFYVDDAELDACYERALRECKTRLEPLKEWSWGARDFRVVDPDGYYVRISSPDRDYRRTTVEPGSPGP